MSVQELRIARQYYRFPGAVGGEASRLNAEFVISVDGRKLRLSDVVDIARRKEIETVKQFTDELQRWGKAVGEKREDIILFDKPAVKIFSISKGEIPLEEFIRAAKTGRTVAQALLELQELVDRKAAWQACKQINDWYLRAITRLGSYTLSQVPSERDFGIGNMNDLTKRTKGMLEDLRAAGLLPFDPEPETREGEIVFRKKDPDYSVMIKDRISYCPIDFSRQIMDDFGIKSGNLMFNMIEKPVVGPKKPDNTPSKK